MSGVGGGTCGAGGAEVVMTNNGWLHVHGQVVRRWCC